MVPSFADYAIGLLFFTLTLAGAGTTAVWTVRCFADRCSGLVRLLAVFLVATFAVVWAHMIPGVLGVLSRETVALTSLVMCVLAGAAVRGRPSRSGGGPPQPPHMTIEALVGLTLIGVASLALLVDRAATPLTAIDALTFHLPVAGSWIQDGSIWGVWQFTPDLANGNYPQNGDVAQLAVVLPFDNDAFVRLVSAPLFTATGVAAFALGRELGASPSSSALAAALVLAVPSVLEPALLQGQTDVFMLATLAIGMLFLLRFWRTRLRSDLALAGIGLGLAFGTKWYAVGTVAVIAAVWLAAELVASPRGAGRLRRLLGRGTSLVAIGLLAGGFWLVRNLVESGNPLFPQEVGAGGVTLFDAPPDPVREASGFSIAHYLFDGGVWKDFLLPAFSRSLALPALLLLLGALGAASAAVRNRSLPGSRQVLVGSGCVLLLLVAYAVTPYTAFGLEGAPILTGANTRYAVPALLVAAPLMAWLLDRLGGWRLPASWLILVAMVDGLGRGEQARAAAVGGALLVTAIVVAIALLLRRGTWTVPRRRVVAVAVAVLALAAGGGAIVQDRFNDGRYLGLDPTYDWVQAHAAPGASIALANRWPVSVVSPVWPMFGPRVDNHVEYVGEFRQEMLRQIAHRSHFQGRLAQGGYDLLLVGKGDGTGADGGAEEARWAEQAGWTPVSSSPYFTLLAAPSRP